MIILILKEQLNYLKSLFEKIYYAKKNNLLIFTTVSILSKLLTKRNSQLIIQNSFYI